MKKKISDITRCTKYQALIQKRIDGDITAEENLELDEHIADCPFCFEELTKYAAMSSMSGEFIDDDFESTDDFFSSLSAKLADIKPATGLAGLLNHPLFSIHKQWAFATASLIIVSVLALSVGNGLFADSGSDTAEKMDLSKSKVRIMTNSGDTFVWEEEDAVTDQQLAVLDDLDRAYQESLNQNSQFEKGYIHTSWESDGNE